MTTVDGMSRSFLNLSKVRRYNALVRHSLYSSDGHIQYAYVTSLWLARSKHFYCPCTDKTTRRLLTALFVAEASVMLSLTIYNIVTLPRVSSFK